jgi:hypothetical protein
MAIGWPTDVGKGVGVGSIASPPAGGGKASQSRRTMSSSRVSSLLDISAPFPNAVGTNVIWRPLLAAALVPLLFGQFS